MQNNPVVYKAVFADLDRTLFNSEGHLSAFTKEVLEKLLASGVDFLPCSGRSLKSFAPELFEIKGIRHAVSSNGVSLDDMQTRESLSYLLLPENIPEKIFDFLKNEKVDFECYIKGQAYCCKERFENPADYDPASFREEYIKSTRVPVDEIKVFILEHKHELGALGVISNPKDTVRIFEALKETFPEVYMTNSEPFLIEISNRECGKHKGIKRYCEMFGVKPEEVIAFGDGNNDVEMLQTAGLGIAVGNATDACKKIAARIVETNNEDGVAKELCRIFGI